MVDSYIRALASYAIQRHLIGPEDEIYAVNSLLGILNKNELEACDIAHASLPEILNELTEFAVQSGLCENNTVARDLFDTRLMGGLTPFPHEVIARFRALQDVSAQSATDWFYQFSKDTNYIREDRIAKDKKWDYAGKYGTLHITINLSKPEKDPRAIAAARLAPQSGYPKCQLCAENEGYFGRMNHPARENLRMIPLRIAGCDFYLQYSPYVYYKEHCIVLNKAHTPMKIDAAAFEKLLDFVDIFPHYILGSNADLPIVGGSILSHDHFQGGHFLFPMARAHIEKKLDFNGYADIQAGIVHWPMSVIRLSGPDKKRLIALADKILNTWRGYSDAEACIFAQTEDQMHNTITPIARKNGNTYELDLVLRNNLTTKEHPLGLYHPHADKHHIKKENIGLIEVMGLAVLPARLDKELVILRDALLSGADIRADERIAHHADWVDRLRKSYDFNPENTDSILQKEVGHVFEQVLEDAGVYPCTDEGRQSFIRFINAVNAK